MKNNFKIGTDIVEVHRINKLIEDYNYKFFNRIFTEREVISFYQNIFFSSN